MNMLKFAICAILLTFAAAASSAQDYYSISFLTKQEV